MKKVLYLTILIIFFPLYTYASTVLYYPNESIFVESSNIVSYLFGLSQESIIPDKKKFLEQVRSEKDFLYILSHGLPDKGLMISEDLKSISWGEIAKNTCADILIVDACFSGQIIEKEYILKKPSLIISSASKHFYSYNPKVLDDKRFSLLSVALFMFFSPTKIHEQMENYLGIEVASYNKRYTEVFGIKNMLRSLKYAHFRLYIHQLNKEPFISSLKRVEQQNNIPFKGISTIEYKVNLK